MQPEDWARVRYFKPSDFRYPEKMGYEFVFWLDNVRHEADVPMFPSSGHRPPAYNASVGGAKDSAHVDVPCDAVDIDDRVRPDDPNWNYSRWRIVTAAIKLGCRRIGMYPNGSLHLDRTEDRRPAPRMWMAVSGHL